MISNPRTLNQVGALWRVALALCLCRDVGGLGGEGEGGDVDGAVDRHRQLRERVEVRWGLDGCWGLKPMLSGNEIAEVMGLDLKKDGAFAFSPHPMCIFHTSNP